MDIETLREYCLTFADVEETFPFDDVSLVFKVKGKMFLLLPLDAPELVSMKCDPERAIDLRERYAGVAPAWHFNKKHWNQVALSSDVPDSLIKELVRHSYELVRAKLPKQMR